MAVSHPLTHPVVWIPLVRHRIPLVGNNTSPVHRSPASLTAGFFPQHTNTRPPPLPGPSAASPASGTFGPFKPSREAVVPLWLALDLKKRGMCEIYPPDWLQTAELQVRPPRLPLRMACALVWTWCGALANAIRFCPHDERHLAL